MPHTEFRLDHVVISTSDRDAIVAQIATATGLQALRGYAEGGEAVSLGVRFANGPFLDIFVSPEPSTALIVQGTMDATEALATKQDWAARIGRRESTPESEIIFPWSMAFFRRGQGLLTTIGVIEYATDPQAWVSDDFSGTLYKPGVTTGSTLDRVWLATDDLTRAERDLKALGYEVDGELSSEFWPRQGLRFRGQGADLVLASGATGVVRLDINNGGGPASELILAEAPRLILNDNC